MVVKRRVDYKGRQGEPFLACQASIWNGPRGTSSGPEGGGCVDLSLPACQGACRCAQGTLGILL